MPTYRVTVPVIGTESYHIEADSKEQAVLRVLYESEGTICGGESSFNHNSKEEVIKTTEEIQP